ncbi:MAG: signal peptidase I [Clostridia bacterium]|nr:signal peptidase I [Clostridia bacterium]
MLDKIKNNKTLKIIWNVIYYILVVFVVLLLFMVILQRVSNNNLSLGGFRIYNIVTESMLPKYKIGDVLIAKAIDTSKLKVGDDIVYKGEKGNFANKIITHQLIAIDEENGEKIFHTKGLANNEEDPTITSDQITGKIIYKTFILSKISKVVYNIYAFYFSIFIPIAIIIFIQIRKNVTALKEEKEEAEKAKKDK